MSECGGVSGRTGDSPNSAVQVARPDRTGGGRAGAGRDLARTRAPQTDPRTGTGARPKNIGSGFFQRCLAKNRGSTPEQQRFWRDGIYDRIRELMSMQGSLTIERMCTLAPVSRAGFYRSLQQQAPAEEEDRK